MFAKFRAAAADQPAEPQARRPRGEASGGAALPQTTPRRARGRGVCSKNHRFIIYIECIMHLPSWMRFFYVQFIKIEFLCFYFRSIDMLKT